MKIGKKFKYFSFAVLVGALFCPGKIMNVSAQVAPDFKTYTEKLPETVVRKSTGTTVFLNQSTTPVVRDWYSNDDDGYQLYCSDRKIEQVGDDTLVKGERMEYGIAYLLMNSYPNVNLINNVYAYKFDDPNVSSESSQYLANVFITQYALWAYQGTVDPSSLGNTGLGYTGDNKTSFDMYFDSRSGKVVTEAGLWKAANIDAILAKAKEVNANSPYDATMTMKMDGEWTKIEGTDNVKSGLISTSISSGNTGTYSLTFDNAPEGTKVYTEDGNEVTDLNSISVSSKIYLVVPKSNQKEDYKFSMKANSTLTYNAAYQYVDKVGGHQPSVLVGPESKDLNASLEMTLTPDTALSVSNSIYFLGFLILISGVFVIYANVKTKEVSE
jgi:hypothetical protein